MAGIRANIKHFTGLIMINNQKYIVLPGGKECKPVNPFDKVKGWLDWAHCEAYNDTQILPLTEVMPEGVEFEGDETYQIRFKNRYDHGQYKQWHTISKEQFDNRICLKSGMWQTQIAIKPLKAIEPTDAVENKEERVERLIDSIVVNDANFKHVASTGKINGTLRAELRRILQHEQSQSIDGIVGFVLEWVAERANMTYKSDPEITFQSKSSGHRTVLVDRVGILEMKSDIIKEYKNGK